MVEKRGKKGNILTENIIFIILNLVFISIIVLYVSLRTNDTYVMEELYAKQIALMIDAAKPGMEISLNMKDAIDKFAREKGKSPDELLKEETEEIVTIKENVVIVKLGRGDKPGYSYSFFNNVDVNSYLDTTNNEEFVFIISGIETEESVENE